MRDVLRIVFCVAISACSPRASGRAVGVAPSAATDPSGIALYAITPVNRRPSTVGFVDAEGTNADITTLRLREEAARLGANAVVDIELRIRQRSIEVSGRAVRWE